MPAARTAFTCLAFSVVAGCSLDWAVRADLGDAGAASDGGGDVALADHIAEIDAPVFDATDCAALASDIAAKKKAARACVLAQPNQCKTTVKDECGCEIVVTSPLPATATSEYASAVTRFTAAACATKCAATCPIPNASTIAPASWACVQNPSAVECFP